MPNGALDLTPLVRFASISATLVPAPLATVAASGMGSPVQAVHLAAPLVAHLAAPTMVAALVVARGLGAEGDPSPQNHRPQPAEIRALGRHPRRCRC